MAFRVASIFFFMITLCSCVTHQPNERRDHSDFYLSIAPTFDSPYDYEIRDNLLTLREYSGLGGYNWGKSRVVASVHLTASDLHSLRDLFLKAISDSVESERTDRENNDFVVVTDGIAWTLKSNSHPQSISISTNNPRSSSFEDILSFLNNALEGE